MTAGKVTLITAALVGTVALGIAAAPKVRENWSKSHATVADAKPAPGPSAAVAGTHTAPARVHHATPVKTDRKKDAGTIRTIAVSAWSPQFRDRAKAVLNRGADLEIAAANFDSGEQFMTVAHAARNTELPFMVLKDRVVTRREPLAKAIHELKPQLDAAAEVARARAAAREDFATN